MDGIGRHKLVARMGYVICCYHGNRGPSETSCNDAIKFVHSENLPLIPKSGNYLLWKSGYIYFRLSVAVILTCEHYFTPIHGLILDLSLEFNCTFHSLRDISISGFGRHFRLSVIIGIA